MHLIDSTYKEDEESIISTEMIVVPDSTELVTVEENMPFVITDGYHMTSNGSFNNGGNGWMTVLEHFLNDGENTYIFDHPNMPTIKPQIRVVGFNASNTVIVNHVVNLGDVFTLNKNVTKFTFNGNLHGSFPVTGNVPFANKQQAERMILNKLEVKEVRKEEGHETLKSKLQQIDTVINESSKRLGLDYKNIKVLIIGNSFSEDVSQYIHNICASANVNAVFGNMHRPAENLQGHSQGISSNALYTYYKRISNNGVSSISINPNFTLLQGLRDENWDVVIYQQVSGLSGVYSSFNPHLQNLISYVRANTTNPNLVHGLHMTWAYPIGSTESGFANYNNNQTTMYNSIVDAYQQAMSDNDIDLLIPSGTAVQNARSIPHLQGKNNDMASDGLHLGPIGDFIGGLTLFESIISSKLKIDLFNDVKYTIDGKKYDAYLCKLAVKNAILNPFNVTDI